MVISQSAYWLLAKEFITLAYQQQKKYIMIVRVHKYNS